MLAWAGLDLLALERIIVCINAYSTWLSSTALLEGVAPEGAPGAMFRSESGCSQDCRHDLMRISSASWGGQRDCARILCVRIGMEYQRPLMGYPFQARHKKLLASSFFGPLWCSHTLLPTIPRRLYVEQHDPGVPLNVGFRCAYIFVFVFSPLRLSSMVQTC